MKPWKEWDKGAPPPCGSGCVEAEYLDEAGNLVTTPLTFFHYAEESKWGHSTGDWRQGTYQTHHAAYLRWRYVGPPVPTLHKQGKSIVIWEWWDAPGELRALSDHGGDEDWVALVPKNMNQPSWMESGTSFGCCSVSENQLPDGRWVYIGAHA
jgi:hypothetical protein